MVKDQEHSDGKSHRRPARREAPQRTSGQSGARRSTPRGKGSRRPGQSLTQSSDLQETRRSSQRQAGADGRKEASFQGAGRSQQSGFENRDQRRRNPGVGSQRPRISRDQRRQALGQRPSGLRVIPGGRLEETKWQGIAAPEAASSQGVKDSSEGNKDSQGLTGQAPASQQQAGTEAKADTQPQATGSLQPKPADSQQPKQASPEAVLKEGEPAPQKKGLFSLGKRGRKRSGQAQRPERKNRAERISQGGEGAEGKHKVRRRAVKAIVAVLAAILIAGVVVVILSTTPLFTIKHIDVVPCDHVSREQVLKLAQIDSKATLLNYDADRIQAALKKNPWVKSVKISRDFPDTLRIQIQEHKVSAICLIGPENVGWYLSDDGHWIEPVKLEASSDTSIKDVALTLAQKQHCLLIYDLPLSCQPKAGKSATDKQIQAVMKFVHGFSADFTSQIVSFSAPSANGISCVLKSGVQISLGAPEDIDEKQQAIQAILNRHKNQVTYINVRAADAPVYRKVGVTPTQAGSGVDSGQAVKDPANKNDGNQAVPDGTNPADKKFTDNDQG